MVRFCGLLALVLLCQIANSAERRYEHPEITKLSEDEAKVLVRNATLQFNHDPIDLPNLRQLDAKVAKVLAQNTERLSLNKISRLQHGVSESLKLFRGNSLELHGLKVLSVSDALNLADGDCNNLSIGVARLGVKQVSALANHDGFSISFPNVRTLSNECAKELADYRCQQIYFDDISSSDKETLAILKANPKVKFVAGLHDATKP